VIIMVLVLLAIGAMVVAGLLNRASTRMDQSRSRLDHMQARSLAQSGLEGVLVEMAAQRARMLAGDAPELTEEWTTPVMGAGGTRVGRIRLVALAQTPDGRDIVALSQGACVDVMAMPEGSLKTLLGEKAGGAITAARGSRPMTSVLGAMNEAGLTADAVAAWSPAEGVQEGAQEGTLEESDSSGSGLENARRGRIVRGDAGRGDAGRGDEGGGGASDAFGANALLVRDAISVGTFDPIGLWNGEAVARVDLSGAVDSTEIEEVAKLIEDAFGTLGAGESSGASVPAADGSDFLKEVEVARVSELVARMFDSDVPPRKTSELLRAMRRAGAAPSGWRLAWGVRFADEIYSRGRVDINRAPREVLATVPGIDATAAEGIVSRRAGLSSEALSDPTWPAVQGIITPEQLEQAADWITTRSLQWRVRIEAAVLDAADAEEDARGDRGEEDGRARKPMGVVTLEVVIDASAERVRVAYLRDVSLEDAIARVERSQRAAAEEGAVDAGDRELGDGDAVAASDREAGRLRGDDVRAGSRATTRSERMAERARSDAESGRVRRGDASARRGAGNLRGDGGGGSGSGAEASGGAGSGSGGGESAEKPKRPARRELEARDNRTGRWRP
jgi:hypothetical protein